MRKETYVRLDRRFPEEMTDYFDVMRREAAPLVGLSPDDLPRIIVDTALPDTLMALSTNTQFGLAITEVRINPGYLLSLAEEVSGTKVMETIPGDQGIPAVLYVSTMYAVDLMLGPLYPPDTAAREDLIAEVIRNTRQGWERLGRKFRTIHT